MYPRRCRMPNGRRIRGSGSCQKVSYVCAKYLLSYLWPSPCSSTYSSDHVPPSTLIRCTSFQNVFHGLWLPGLVGLLLVGSQSLGWPYFYECCYGQQPRPLRPLYRGSGSTGAWRLRQAHSVRDGDDPSHLNSPPVHLSHTPHTICEKYPSSFPIKLTSVFTYKQTQKSLPTVLCFVYNPII